MDLYAPPWVAFARVTLPLMAPALVSGWLLAFTLSLDDVVVASFTSGPGASTLPMVVFSSTQLGADAGDLCAGDGDRGGGRGDAARGVAGAAELDCCVEPPPRRVAQCGRAWRPRQCRLRWRPQKAGSGSLSPIDVSRWSVSRPPAGGPGSRTAQPTTASNSAPRATSMVVSMVLSIEWLQPREGTA